MTETRKIDVDSIYAELRSEILSGTHPAGAPFKEIPLSKRFGVSRTPMRQVLSRLEQEKLLVREDRGLKVPAANPESVVQVYDLRIQLEGTAAAEAARAHSLRNLLELEALFTRDRSLKDPSNTEMIATNLEFHAAVWKATHNSVLVDILERLTTHLIQTPKPTLAVSNRWAESLDEHEALIRAIENRDEALARQLAEEHMKTAKSIRLKLFRESAQQYL
ncbi:GntR family transcriptional regulator [Corynebacterium callunae]|uniref:GntR family transcriptional regulator n=1 Tax=Corynebacterium callunae TaxID=1721 RepID=UPI0039819D34